jgi:hypothetical protein
MYLDRFGYFRDFDEESQGILDSLQGFEVPNSCGSEYILIHTGVVVKSSFSEENLSIQYLMCRPTELKK